MGVLADQLAGIRVAARVPGTEIHGEVRGGRGDVGVSFGQDTYQWLKESHLEHHLATLARLLTAGWTREYRTVLSDSLLCVDPSAEVRNQDYERARDAIAATGSSADGRIVVSAVGLRDFTVRVRPGTVRELREQEFTARVREAADAFRTDYLDQIRELKLRCFGPA